MEFNIANIKQDFDLLLKAKEDSTDFVTNNINDKFTNYGQYQEILINKDKMA